MSTAARKKRKKSGEKWEPKVRVFPEGWMSRLARRFDRRPLEIQRRTAERNDPFA